MNKTNSIKIILLFLVYQNKEFIQQFWNLSVQDINIRVKAIEEIINHLLTCKDIANDEKLPNCSEDLCYTVKRLIKGLSSSRDSARQGFSAALVYFIIYSYRFVLKSFPNIKNENIINLFKEILVTSHGSKRQEKKDIIFAQVFAVIVLYRSKRIYDGNNVFF